MKKRIFAITGAGGHLGSVIAHQLVMQGEQVRTFYLPNDQNLVSGTAIFYGDVTKPGTLVPFLLHGDDEEVILIHCAGLISISKHVSRKVYDVNVTGTENIVEIAKALGVKRMVYISSVHALPPGKMGEEIIETKIFDPRLVDGEYAKTKAEATNYVMNATTAKFETVVVHPSGIIGPGTISDNDFLSHFIYMYINGKLKVAVNGGYDFVDVRDVASGTIQAALKGRSGENYILNGKYYSVREIIEMLAKITGRKPIKTYFSTKFVKSVAWMAEFYYKIRKQTPLFTAYSMNTLEANANFVRTKAEQDLGYAPRELFVTLVDTVEEVRALTTAKTTIREQLKKKKKRN